MANQSSKDLTMRDLGVKAKHHEGEDNIKVQAILPSAMKSFQTSRNFFNGDNMVPQSMTLSKNQNNNFGTLKGLSKQQQQFATNIANGNMVSDMSGSHISDKRLA